MKKIAVPAAITAVELLAGWIYLRSQSKKGSTR